MGRDARGLAWAGGVLDAAATVVGGELRVIAEPEVVRRLNELLHGTVEECEGCAWVWRTAVPAMLARAGGLVVNVTLRRDIAVALRQSGARASVPRKKRAECRE